MPKKVLLVEGSNGDVSTVNHMLRRTGLDLSVAHDGVSAFNRLRRDEFDLVVCEVSLPKMSGIDLLKKIKEVRSTLPVILMAADARVADAVEAMKLGAHDFFMKPFSYEMIKMATAHLEDTCGKKSDPGRRGKYEIVTADAEMQRLLAEARKIADSRAAIFIQGESGTGKELFARFVHQHSRRRDDPFVAINCAALPETLLESELFGHERGAFTGAATRKKGKFELANNGTLLLDEISEMDYQLQSKLLRVLQEKEIDRLGGAGPIPIDVRVISTTNRDIFAEIDEGRFREDLFYRLNVIPVHLPPLRERVNDIPLLAQHFIEKYNRIENRSVKGLTQEALDALVKMPWKGNVRELENTMERATLICGGDVVEAADVTVDFRGRRSQENMEPAVTGSLKDLEQQAIYQTLDRTDGNRTHAAQILGISVRTLRNKLNEYREKMEAA